MAQPGPLSGITIIDLSRILAGPYCTLLLAELGARVIKVEPPGQGDDARQYGPFKNGKSTYFASINRGKESISLDLKSPTGRDVFDRLLDKADALVENFRPGTMEKLGYGWEALHSRYPRLVYAAASGFGHTGPYSHYPAYDMVVQGLGGVMSITGERDGPPAKPGTTLGDTGTGMLLAISILGALYRRQTTGKGERIEVAMQDAMLQYIRVAFAAQATSGQPAQRNGAKILSGIAAPSGVYPCKPGGPNDYVYVYTSRANPAHWRHVLEVIGRADLIGDPRFETTQARAEHEAEVDALISAWTRKHDKHEAMRRLSAAGVPAGAVLDTMELQNDADFERRGIMQVMQHPGCGPFKMPTWPVRHDGKTLPLAPAPLLGQHTDEILGEWLGLGTAEVEKLRAEGVI